MTATIPILQSTKALARFLDHIQSAGVPSKVTGPYLKTVGFRSGNDAALIPAFKALGFIDSTGAPTDNWKKYRDKTIAPAVLGDAIKSCYSGLFDIYPDAERKDSDAVANWVRSSTGFAGITVDRAVRTFKALVSHASFQGAPQDPTPVSSSASGSSNVQPAPTITLPATSVGGFPSVNINLELHLAATSDPKIYENFFKAMKEHLLEGSK